MSSENKQICEFFSRIEAALKERGMQKKDFAEKLGILPQQLARYKSTQYPSVEIIIRMSLVLGVSTDYLFGLSTSVKQPSSETEQKLEALKKVVPLISEANSILSRNF